MRPIIRAIYRPVNVLVRGRRRELAECFHQSARQSPSRYTTA